MKAPAKFILKAPARLITGRGKRQELGGTPVVQEVPVHDVDPAKLSRKLKTTFGPGAFEVQMRHNVYRISAHRKLSQSEIAECASAVAITVQFGHEEVRPQWWQYRGQRMLKALRLRSDVVANKKMQQL